MVENSKKYGEDRNEVSDGSNKIISVNKSLRRTCWYYKRRTCKYGSGCKDLHPPACKNIKEYGECSDNSCKLLHQQVCRDYFNQGYCSRSNCWFVHPSKIGQRNQARLFTYRLLQNGNRNWKKDHQDGADGWVTQRKLSHFSYF